VGRQFQIPAEWHNCTDDYRGFLVGMGIGDIVSKTNQANTHYAALISYPNGQE
jgi:hypothetical protein